MHILKPINADNFFCCCLYFHLHRFQETINIALLQMSLSLSFYQCPQTAAQKTTTVISASEEQTKQRSAQYECEDARAERFTFLLPL